MKKKVILIILILILICGSILGCLYISDQNRKKEEQRKKQEIEDKINDIKSHYSENVITNKEASLYTKEDDKYIENGKINENIKIKLTPAEITVDTEYFYIEGLNMYIYYKDVDPSDEYVKSDRYKNYIPFNQNIKTKDITTFYDENNNYLYTLNESFDFVIYIKDTERYGIEYNNELLYINSEDVDSIYDSNNTDLVGKNRIRVLTYHALYNPETTECNTSICEKLEDFETHLKYIRDNDYFTLRLPEVELFLDGKLNIPQKSIAITIDDGNIIDPEAITLLEKYKVNATVFVITSWVDPNSLKSDYLDLESHTHNMHNQYECPGYGMQGGGILCLPEEQVLEDLKTSQEKLGGSVYFAYPFFDFNARAIELLKKAGFHMAFIGQYDTDGYSYPNVTDKFKVRRKTIFAEDYMWEFISYLE